MKHLASILSLYSSMGHHTPHLGQSATLSAMLTWPPTLALTAKTHFYDFSPLSSVSSPNARCARVVSCHFRWLHPRFLTSYSHNVIFNHHKLSSLYVYPFPNALHSNNPHPTHTRLLPSFSPIPLLRAIPFEKLVGGVSGVSFSDHPAATFHYFLGYPAVIFSPLT